MNNELLLSLALKENESFINQLIERDKWGKTNRKSFMTLVPKSRGDMAEKLIESMCEKIEVKCKLRHDNTSGFDAWIGEKKIPVEIKYAAEGNNGGYTFNQIRPDDKGYRYIIFFFMSPTECEFYTIKREDLKLLTLNKQHAGNKTYTMTDTKKNMSVLKKMGDGSFVDAINKIK